VGSAIEGDRDGAVDVAEHQAALVVDDLGVDGAGGAEAGIGEGQLRRPDDLGAAGYRNVAPRPRGASRLALRPAAIVSRGMKTPDRVALSLAGNPTTA